MFQIIAHVKPNENSEHYQIYAGAYAVLFINYKDIDGSYELAKYYIENDDWDIMEIEEDYYIINSIDEMNDDYKKYYDEVIELGYSLIFNLYEKEDE